MKRQIKKPIQEGVASPVLADNQEGSELTDVDPKAISRRGFFRKIIGGGAVAAATAVAVAPSVANADVYEGVDPLTGSRTRVDGMFVGTTKVDGADWVTLRTADGEIKYVKDAKRVADDAATRAPRARAPPADPLEEAALKATAPRGKKAEAEVLAADAQVEIPKDGLTISHPEDKEMNLPSGTIIIATSRRTVKVKAGTIITNLGTSPFEIHKVPAGSIERSRTSRGASRVAKYEEVVERVSLRHYESLRISEDMELVTAPDIRMDLVAPDSTKPQEVQETPTQLAKGWTAYLPPIRAGAKISLPAGTSINEPDIDRNLSPKAFAGSWRTIEGYSLTLAPTGPNTLQGSDNSRGGYSGTIAGSTLKMEYSRSLPFSVRATSELMLMPDGSAILRTFTPNEDPGNLYAESVVVR